MPQEFVGLIAVGLVAVAGLSLRLYYARGEARRRAQLRLRDGGAPELVSAQTAGPGTSQRYNFAHRALPAVAFRDPAKFLRGLNAANARGWLEALWTQAGEGARTRSPFHGLWHRVQRLESNVMLALVRLPAPAEVGEAHFVAMLATELPAPANGLTAARLFTLELSRKLDTGTPFTMLCEWTQEGVHCNHGRGPELVGDTAVPGPADKAFVDAILARYLGDRRGGYIYPLANPPPPPGMSPIGGGH